MAYIGKSPTGTGVRSRYYFTQSSGGGTSISGTDDNGKTLTYTDGEYVDVYLNGVLLVHGTDYGTGTANTISSLAALAGGDVVEVVVYDIFNVAKINNEAVRRRYYKTASGSETSISGADDSGATITFPANAEIEVKLNGVALVQGTDYNTTTANTVGGLSALSAGQVVEVVVYERFVLADTVSKADGGTFGKPVTFTEGLTATDVITGQNDSSSISTGLVVKNNNTTDDNGMRLDFMSKDTSDNDIVFGRIETVVKNHATEKADLNIHRYNDSGTFATAVQFNKDGYAKFEGGITFNGDTAAANRLDDYEEGTWTPQISATDGIGTLTYTAQVGHYTKIGNRVNFHMYVLINQKGTVAGSIRYTLPFSSASVTNLYTAVSFWVNGSVNGQVFDGDFHLQAYIAPGSSIVVPQSLDGDGSVTHLNAAHISNGMDVMIAGHYRV